jgi:hypothetical protein
MLSKEAQQVQEFLTHPGMEVFKALLYQTREASQPCLKDRLQADLLAAARDGDSIKAAKVAGQIDIIQTILDVPVKYLEKQQVG